MIECSSYTDKWNMSWVVAYLLEFHFGNRPTSNKSLSEAFWKLMGRNVEIQGKKRWADGKRGVPYHIHRLTEKFILAEVSPENQRDAIEFPEYIYTYVLGDRGQMEIDAFMSEFPKHVIDREISRYLAHRDKEESQGKSE